MFERFTERARQVLVLANDEARMLGHTYIGTEHLLLGLLREEEGVAAAVLMDGFSITLGAVHEKVDSRPSGTTSSHLPYTSRAKQVLDLSLREALALGHNYIGTEHILLGLLREGEGEAPRAGLGMKILRSYADPNEIRDAVLKKITRKPEKPAPVSVPQADLSAITEDIAAAVERGVTEGLRRALSRLNLS